MRTIKKMLGKLLRELYNLFAPPEKIPVDKNNLANYIHRFEMDKYPDKRGNYWGIGE